jgi:hypothetical protein
MVVEEQMTREINVADVRRAGQYAWNDATGEFRVYNPDRAHFGFWIRTELDDKPAFTHLVYPALGYEAEDRLQRWHHEDGCGCGLCSEAKGDREQPVIERQGMRRP